LGANGGERQDYVTRGPGNLGLLRGLSCRSAPMRGQVNTSSEGNRSEAEGGSGKRSAPAILRSVTCVKYPCLSEAAGRPFLRPQSYVRLDECHTITPTANEV